MLVIVGLVLAGLGLIWVLAPNLPRLGRLPGDIVIERENSRFNSVGEVARDDVEGAGRRPADGVAGRLAVDRDTVVDIPERRGARSCRWTG
jgi:hypothetical protein